MIFQNSLYCPKCGNQVKPGLTACSACYRAEDKTKKRKKFVAPPPDVDSLITDAPAIEMGKPTRQERNGYEL